MKKIILSALALSLSVSSWAEYSMLVHGSDGKVAAYKCSGVDSVKTDGISLRLHGAKVTEIPFASLDSLTFSMQSSSLSSDTVFVVYKDDKAEVINPFKGEVEITTDGAGVTVNSTVADKDVVYALSGKSSNGYFLIESEKKFKVVLDNLDLTSTGVVSPIRSMSSKGMTFVLRGKSNLTDSAKDTCNAVIRSKGQIVFDAESGNNSLVVNAKQKRAIQSGDYIVMDGGNVEATSTLGNCVRTNDYFLMTGGTMLLNEGTLNVTNGYFQMDGGKLTIKSSQDDAKLVDVETELLDADNEPVVDDTHGAFFFNGGTLTLSSSGEGTRCVKVDGDAIVKAGTINASISGPSLYVSSDGVTNATVMKAGASLQILGGEHTFKVTSAADGARALSADVKVLFDGGAKVTIENAAGLFNYTTEKGTAKTKTSAGIKTDGTIEFNKCDVTVISSAKSNGAVGVSALGSIVVNTDANVNVTAASASSVAIDEDSAGSLLLKGGYISGVSASEVAFDCAISSMGGRLVSVAPVKHASGFSGSTSCVLADRTYNNKAFSFLDAAGKEIISGKGGYEGITSGILMVAAPFKSGEEYVYKLDGDSYEVTAGRVGTFISVSKE